jgi:lipopolysaccharide export system permease protein
MRVSRVLALHFSREVVQYSLLSFLALTAILVSQNVLKRLEDLVAVGVTFSEFLSVLACIIPMLSAYSMPLAFLFGVVFAMSRMSDEGEILAMGASGLGIGALLIPALILGGAVTGLSAFVMLRVEHRAHRELRTIVSSLAARGGMLEPGKFHSLVDRTLYVEERDRENNLRGVMISDHTHPDRPFVIFSERGRFSFDDENLQFRLGLEHGAIHLEDESARSESTPVIAFDSLEYAFDVRHLISNLTNAVRPRQMNSSELHEVVRRVRSGGDLSNLDQRNPIEYELEIHRRYTLPLAPLLFAPIAIPLGLGRTARTRSRGAVISLALGFAYYSLFMQARFLALDGWIVPSWALWLPNAVFATVAMILLIRARHRV